MIKKKLSKALAIGLTAVFMALTLASCGSGNSSENKIVYNIMEEEKTIDPGLNESLNAGTLIQNAFEGLVRVDENEKIQPGVAEKWTISDDGLVYTFNLRKGSKWSDGKEVTAKDFAFAWKRVLTKEFASPYSGYMMMIKGAQEYFDGKAKDVSGIEVVNDNTLKVTLTNPTAYFLELTSFPTYMPVREDIVGDTSWATKPQTYITNGPLVLKEWRPKDIMVYEKNENYWNIDTVKLDKLEVKMIAEPMNALNAFKTGELDYIDKVPAQEVDNILKEGIGKKYQNIGTYFYLFNLTDNLKKINPEAYKALSNPKVRRALALSIDRQALVTTATKAGEVPASSIVPSGITDANGKDFKSKEYFDVKGNAAEAKALLAEAGYPEGKGFPEIEIIYNNGANHDQIAQAAQEMWRKNLGINVKLSNQEWKVFLDSKSSKNYVMCRMGWVADYKDPSTFLNLFKSNDPNNDTGYSNKEVDALLSSASAEMDEAKRLELYHQAEEKIMADMPAIPLFYYADIVCITKDIEGVHRSPLGFTTFYKASKTAK